jgi:hypothetical protein
LLHFKRSARLEATATLQRLPSKRNIQIGIISNQSNSKLAELSTSLGADFLIGDLTADDRIQHRGSNVAYVGDGSVEPHIAAEAYVAISLAAHEMYGADDDPPPIRLLYPRLFKLGELWDIASFSSVASRLLIAIH